MVGAFKSVWLLQIVWQHQRSWHQHEGEGGDGRQQGGVEAQWFWLKWYIMMSPTSMISSSWLSLPSTVSSTTNTYDLNIVRLVERITIFQVNQHYYSVSHPSWRKFQPKWYILMSTTSLGFSSNLFMPSTVSSTNKSHVLNVVSLVERIKNFHVNHQHHIISHSILNKIPTEVIPPYVRDLPGLLLLVVLAVHSAVDYFTTSAKSRQVGYPRKGLSMNVIVLQSSCLWAW